jgi:hypothetical protein
VSEIETHLSQQPDGFGFFYGTARRGETVVHINILPPEHLWAGCIMLEEYKPDPTQLAIAEPAGRAKSWHRTQAAFRAVEVAKRLGIGRSSYRELESAQQAGDSGGLPQDAVRRSCSPAHSACRRAWLLRPGLALPGRVRSAVGVAVPLAK